MTTPESGAPGPKETTPKKGLRFWVVFFAISVMYFVAMLDGTILTTALPTIVVDLQSGSLYIWAVNAYLLAVTACGPLFGQASDIFGRRSLTFLSVTSFAVGSVISATAQTTGQLIAGRTIQGIGGGGCVVVPEIITCDIVSLRERGKYVGIIMGFSGIAGLIAPIIGGVLAEQSSWRWIFYLNLPICAVIFAALVVLRLRHPKVGTFRERLEHIDWLGNTILVLAIVSLLLALTWAGSVHPWSSWRTIVPLLSKPTMPPRLFGNRTSGALYAASFIHGLMSYWAGYFLPVVYQATMGASPLRAALMVLPMIGATAAAGILAGSLTTTTGKYLHWHYLGWALTTVSAGLFTLMNDSSPAGYWVGFQILFGAGFAVVFTTQLPALLATLDEKDVAVASATWIFIRNLGAIWGIAVPSSVFNTHANSFAKSRIADDSVRVLLVNGGAYEHATSAFVASFRENPELHRLILDLYASSLRVVWLALVGFSGLGFLLCFSIKPLELRTELSTEYGLETKDNAAEPETKAPAAAFDIRRPQEAES
ncbi:major facilitator superfamily transporter [Colletotrichum musicola]|uniref:Major facilitator superfamily transporter n=1 Tax=Colletotrichum musicola TaxID=2175873 RepID=A0A8H6MQJ2_9PEZI|nr:major facilitator superfamily transporter [Colletotrichum musicola]